MENSNIDNDNLQLVDEWLSRFMEGKLSEEEEAIFFKKGKDIDMLADAVEGLQQFSSLSKAQKQTYEINRQILEHLKAKSQKRTTHLPPMTAIVWTAMILVIILALLAYALIKLKG